MVYYGISDVGLVRSNNEDCFGIYEIADAVLAVVCDGMGGENCGEVASALTLETFASTAKRMCKPKIDQGRLALTERDAYVILYNAAAKANDTLITYQAEHPECEGMGTTLVCALVMNDGKTISWLNVGDSRLYTVDGNDILQVSKDHSYVQHLVDTGEITSKEARTHKDRNLITRAVGIRAEVEPDIDTFPLSSTEVADTHILLCSDGLSGAVTEEECYAIVRDGDRSVKEKAEALVELAKKNDGTDNITVILLDLQSEGK